MSVAPVGGGVLPSSYGARRGPATGGSGVVGVAALGGGEVEVQGGSVGDQQVQRRQGGEGGERLDVAAAGVADGGAVLRLLALAVQEAEPLVVAVAAEGAPQPPHLPAGRAQAA